MFWRNGKLRQNRSGAKSCSAHIRFITDGPDRRLILVDVLDVCRYFPSSGGPKKSKEKKKKDPKERKEKRKKKQRKIKRKAKMSAEKKNVIIFM